jgi:hypothetical protein
VVSAGLALGARLWLGPVGLRCATQGAFLTRSRTRVGGVDLAGVSSQLALKASFGTHPLGCPDVSVRAMSRRGRAGASSPLAQAGVLSVCRVGRVAWSGGYLVGGKHRGCNNGHAAAKRKR